MVMMEQYKQETAQIHAPADLIRRTKEAMRAEELRLQREKAQTSAMVSGRSFAGIAEASASAGNQGDQLWTHGRDSRQQRADRPFGIRSGRIYRWAMPVAAAAAVLLLINAVVMVGNRVGKSAADTSMPAAIDNGASYDTAAEAAEEPADFEVAAAAPAEQENGEGAMPDQSVNQYESKQAEANLYDGGADQAADSYAFKDDAAEASEEDSLQEDAVGEAAGGSAEAAAGGIDSAELSVTQVAEAPAFVDDENTECIMVDGIRVYVGKEPDGQWIAYARMNQVNYMVTGGGDIMTAEDYAVKAYERLAGNADGAE